MGRVLYNQIFGLEFFPILIPTPMVGLLLRVHAEGLALHLFGYEALGVKLILWVADITNGTYPCSLNDLDLLLLLLLRSENRVDSDGDEKQ